MEVRRIFADSRLHFLAMAVYHDLVNGEANAIYRLSHWLVDRGLKCEVTGTRLKATAATARAKHPECLIFDLRGGDPYGIGGVANSVQVSAFHVGYYLDSEAVEELKQQEERYVVAVPCQKPSDRTEAEDTMLRDRSERTRIE